MSDVIEDREGEADRKLLALVGSLAELLDALIENKGARRNHRVGPPHLKATPFVFRDPSEIPTRRQSRMASLIQDPIEFALIEAIKSVGHMLHAEGGHEWMLEAYEMTPEEVRDHREPVEPILNSAWDGIGDWYA